MPATPLHPQRSSWMRLIAIAKVGKAIALVVIGVIALRMSNRDSAELLRHWVAASGLDPGSRLLHEAIASISGLDRHQLREIGLGTFIYAALFLTEGLGLLAEKRWAEYFTIVITGSFVPLEIYETVRHFTVLRIVATALNVAAVAYLVYHLRHTPSARHPERGAEAATS